MATAQLSKHGRGVPMANKSTGKGLAGVHGRCGAVCTCARASRPRLAASRLGEGTRACVRVRVTYRCRMLLEPTSWLRSAPLDASNATTSALPEATAWWIGLGRRQRTGSGRARARETGERVVAVLVLGVDTRTCLARRCAEAVRPLQTLVRRSHVHTFTRPHVHAVVGARGA